MKSNLKYVVLILTLISLYGFIRIYNSYSQQCLFFLIKIQILGIKDLGNL